MVFHIGDIVTGTISGIQPYGAFVSLEGGITGLIHISEITSQFVRNVTDFFQVGDSVQVKILDLDEATHHAKLSIKALTSLNPRRQRRKEIYNYRVLSDAAKNKQVFTSLTQQRDQQLKQIQLERNFSPMIKLDLTYASTPKLSEIYQQKVSKVHRIIHEKTGPGNDYLGWLDYPENYDIPEFQRVLAAAQLIRQEYEVLVVCGIGGSYLGARAAIEMAQGIKPKTGIEILYFGNTFSSTYSKQILDYLKTKKFAINVISKSGKTTETAIAFRLLRRLAIEKYGPEKARKAIFATTDKSRGILKSFADQEHYETFSIPDDVGGRYSVFTSVGLLPMAVAGIDIRQVMVGAAQARIDFSHESIEKNTAYHYAVARDFWYRQGKVSELFVTYEPHLTMFAEWLKQLFGESEGKEGKGLFPTSVNFSTDLHSLGQFVQEGSKILFETVLNIQQPLEDLIVPKEEQDADELNYLAGKNLSEVNQKAMLGTLEAHATTGKVPNVILNISKLDAFHVGYVMYFFMKVCAMSAYLLEVNPFNQPGVEVYKTNMFRLLGKK